MAYDANDPADKKILDDAVAAALEDAREAHEAETQGLKDKNKQLVDKLAKARREGGGENAGEIDRLEAEISDNASKLNAANIELNRVKRELATVTTDRDAKVTALQTESEVSRNLLVNNGLTAALVEAKVAPQFLDDVSASLARQVVVKDDNGERKAFVGDKPLGEFVKEWASSDKGKHYVTAPNNGGGGGTPPGTPPSGAKKIYEMTEAERNAAYLANPADFTARVEAGENKAPPKA